MAEPTPPSSDLTDEQREIQALARDFARAEIRPIAAAVDEADIVSPVDVVAKAAEVGLTSFMLPEEVGGGGIGDVLTGCIVQEELNWGCAGIGNLITSAGFFARPLLEVGTPEQCERWLRPLCAPRPPLTALASTEPGIGSDAAAMTTTAIRTDSGYRLNGQKTWISNGGLAEFYVIFATVAPGTGSQRRHHLCRREERPRRLVRGADAKAWPARDHLDRGVLCRTSTCPPTACSARRARASTA